MAKTLLKIVQDILSAMDSDEVNSIGDTVEAQQVVAVVETVYNDILAKTEFQEHYEVFELEASIDPMRPNLMFVPISVDTVDWLKYSSTTGTGWDELKYLPPTAYIERNYTLSSTYSDDPSVSTYKTMVGDNSIDVYYWNDRDPEYYTHIPNLGVLLDGVNLEFSHTEVKTRTIAYGRKNYEFVREDEFVPNFDKTHYNILYQEAKALAFAEIKQTVHAKAEKSAKDSRIAAQRRKDQGPDATFYRNLPYYGRR